MSCRHRPICRFHRRQKDPADAILHRCRRKRRSDLTAQPRSRRPTPSVDRQKSAATSGRSRWRRRLIVKNRLPCAAVVGGFKNAAVHRRHIEDIRLRRNACDRASASAAIRSDVSPAQNGIEIPRPRLPGCKNDHERDYNCASNESHKLRPFSSATRRGANTPMRLAHFQLRRVHHVRQRRTRCDFRRCRFPALRLHVQHRFARFDVSRNRHVIVKIEPTTVGLSKQRCKPEPDARVLSVLERPAD